MLEIKTWRDPYDAGFSPTRPKQVTFNKGLTVLVGCNGAGKSTLLDNIEDAIRQHRKLNNEIIPLFNYDNIRDGGANAKSEAAFFEDFSRFSNLCTDSEGEAIKDNFGYKSMMFRHFIQTGNTSSRRNSVDSLVELLRKENGEPTISNKRVMLFDAIDSGLSIDSISEIREVFDLMVEDAKTYNVELYLIVSANSYELARNTACFDVNSGKYIDIGNYEDYRKFILKSRKRKEKRIEGQRNYYQKQADKQKKIDIQKIEQNLRRISSIKEKASKSNRELTWYEKHEIEDMEKENKRIHDKYNS